MNEKIKKYWPLLGLFAFYFFVFVTFMSNAGLSSDDGAWGVIALDILEGNLPVLGDGWFIKLPALSAYLQAFFLWIHRSHEAVLIGFFLSGLIAHYFIIKTGELLESQQFGFLCSLLFFFKPIFFNFYAHKTWQVSLFPVFISVFVYAFFCFDKSVGKNKFWFYLMWVVASLGFTAHMAAVFYLAPLLFVTLKYYREVGWTELIPALVMYHGLNWLVLMQFEQWGLFFGAHALLFAMFAWLKWRQPAGFGFRYFLYYRLGLLLILVLLLTADFFLNQFFGVGMRSFLDFFPAASLYIARSNGLEGQLPLLHSWMSLEFILFTLFMVTYAHKKNRLWDFTLLLLIALVGFELFGVYSFFPHQWFIFLLPVLLFTVLWPIRRSLSLCLIVVLMNAAYAFTFAQKIRSSGGQGWHMATLETRNRMLDFVASNGKGAIVQMLNVDWYGARAWEYLYRVRFDRYINVGQGPGVTLYYVYEHDYLGREFKVGEPYSSMQQYRVGEHKLYFVKGQ